MPCGCDEWAGPCCDVTAWNSPCVNAGGPCGTWVSPDDVKSCGVSMDECDEGYAFAEERQMASEWLYEATCRQFPGVCKATVMPRLEPRRCYCRNRAPMASDYLYATSACKEMCEVALSPGPIIDVQQVWVEGREMYGGWEVHDGHRLVNTTGCCWPTCDCSTQPFHDGTFSVTYLYGQEPPLLGRRAAAILAAEIYQLCKCGKCSLAGVVEVASGKKAGDLSTGFRIGHPLIDMFVSQFGCEGDYLTGVWSPEVNDIHPRRITAHA